MIAGFFPATNGSPTTIGYIQNPSVFVNQGSAFGDLGRNVVTGPGWSDLDIALVCKNTRLTRALPAPDPRGMLLASASTTPISPIP